jgi:hypothetical protein
MNTQWFNISGLILDIIGAMILAHGLIIDQKFAIDLGTSKWSGETTEENLKLPQVKDRLKQSKNTVIGLIFFIIGFIFQIIANII